MRKIIDKELLELLDGGMNQKEASQHFSCSEAAISKRLNKLRPRMPKSFEKLEHQEKNFALALAGGKNHTDAAAEAFDLPSRESARTLGKRLAGAADIQTAIAELMPRLGLSRGYRVQKLREHVDNPDPNVSLKALDQTHKLDGSYNERIIIEQPSYAELVKTGIELRRRRIELLRKLGDNRQADLLEELVEMEEHGEIIDVGPRCIE